MQEYKRLFGMADDGLEFDKTPPELEGSLGWTGLGWAGVVGSIWNDHVEWGV